MRRYCHYAAYATCHADAIAFAMLPYFMMMRFHCYAISMLYSHCFTHYAADIAFLFFALPLALFAALLLLRC